ncbi:hypothetical protein BV20DRAFT_1033712 [Pilatotrama ljubarskyi]|nr:hypothetical protein BV20DRAFT_1033712 [Pilatotrama ljubarskyi]
MFPSGHRRPHIVSLLAMVSQPARDFSTSEAPYRCGLVPYPGLHMDYIKEQEGLRAWGFHLVDALNEMTQKFAQPYIIFYPVVSRDGMVFPVNACVRQLQSGLFDPTRAWRGNLVVAKYYDTNYSAMVDASMADYALIKNYLSTTLAPPQSFSAASWSTSETVLHHTY